MFEGRYTGPVWPLAGGKQGDANDGTDHIYDLLVFRGQLSCADRIHAPGHRAWAHKSVTNTKVLCG